MKEISLTRKCNATLFIISAGVLLALLVSCNPNRRSLPRMAPPYLYRDKEPMGTNIAWRLLPGQFNGAITLVSKKMKGNVNALSFLKGTCYILIAKNLSVNDEELEQLLTYVAAGNEFFISAENIDYRLLDTLGIKRQNEYAALDNLMVQKKDASVQVADTGLFGTQRFGFFYYPFADIFTRYDSSTTRVLGFNENRHPDYIAVRYGKGKFYFHLAPAAFSNYFLLTGRNTEYYAAVLSYLNKDAREVLWGDIYKFGKKRDDFSALSIFWNNPLLKYALLTAVALMLFYIAFGSKRKRRLVPVLPPNTNASLSFVQTIGNLYLQKKDNRNIGIKKMTYFLEYVRSNFHINTSNINTEFIQALSRKSGIALDKVQDLMEKTDSMNKSENITDQELFDINNLIDEFYKK